MPKKPTFRLAFGWFAAGAPLCIVCLTMFGLAARSASLDAPPPIALSPAEISTLAAQLNNNVAAARVESYAVISRFVQANVATHGTGSASAIASVAIAAPGMAGARIRDVDLGDGLAHAAVAFGVNSDAAKNIAATVGREASRPVRNYFIEITKALTGGTTLADIANDDIGGVGDISNGGNGLGVNLTPNLPGTASCLNPSCTQL